MALLQKIYLIIFLASFSRAERILFLNPIGSKSHKIFFMSIAEALAERGHQVTYLSSVNPFKQTENVREVMIENFSLDHILSNVFEEHSFIHFMNLFNKAPALCTDTLAQKQVQDLKNESFDLIILSFFFSECYLSFVHHFKVPFIYVSPAGMYGPFNSIMGNIEFPSFTPNKLLEQSFPISFIGRLTSIVSGKVLELLLDFYAQQKTDQLCREMNLCPPDMPYLSEFHKNASLVVINSVKTLDCPPRPMMPNIIHAGGAHIKPAKKLPKELEEWASGSGNDGFIFFSLGSALKPSFLPEKYRKILINVFGSLKQTVLWKWDEDSMPDLPPNVKLAKWLPQQDILGHARLKLFITHGGLLSTLESTYFGVKVIGMPVFADQVANMKEAEREGWGKVMQWEDLEENAFRTLLIDTINDDSLTVVSKRRSSLMRDTPIPPDQEAAYWVEYVIRYNGAPHIKSPVLKMQWYQVYNTDVYAFLLVLFLGLCLAFLFLLKVLLRVCGITKTTSKNTKQKGD